MLKKDLLLKLVIFMSHKGNIRKKLPKYQLIKINQKYPKISNHPIIYKILGTSIIYIKIY